jgi:hypothetical protein
MIRPMLIAAVGVVWLACSGPAHAQDDVVLHIIADKSVVMPGESVKLQLWARLEPGVGAPSLWNLPGSPPEWGTVHALHSISFNVYLVGATAKWSEYQIGPGKSFGSFGAPIFASNGLFKNVLYHDYITYQLTENLLYSVTLTPQSYEATTLWLVPDNPSSKPVVMLDLPSQPKPMGSVWSFAGENLAIQIVPAPGVLGALGLLAAWGTRRRRWARFTHRP